MSDLLSMFGTTNDPYPVKKIGSFGQFATSESFPVEFFMTTFGVHELDELTFAKEIKPEDLDFGLLMQREIDEERVKEEIKPYLKSGSDKTIFFPPLLVSILPVVGKKIQAYYQNQVFETNSNQLIREFSQLFKITHPLFKEHNAYELTITSAEGEKKHKIRREPCQLEMNFSRGKELGCKLVVIDGQHRLKALKDLYNDSKEAIESLVVPVCLLFTPNSTQEIKECNGDIPSVTEVFRQLFVDVNNNAIQVGGHFNILLGESEVGKLICRDFCSQVLKTHGLEYLSLVEWNQKTKKLSTEITGKYTITSIGVLHMALDEFIATETIYSFLLDFSSDDGILIPEFDENEAVPLKKAEWSKFSLVQKRVIEEKIRDNITPLLLKIFFDIDAYKTNREIFIQEINELKTLAQQDGGNINAQPALDKILEYIAIPSDSKYKLARDAFNSFESKVRTRRKELIPDIAFRNVFQRAIISAWAELLKLSKKHQLDTLFATEVLIMIVNASLSNNGEIFSIQKKYIQNYIFNQTRISPNKDSVTGLVSLILGNLLKPDVVKKVRSILPEEMETQKVKNLIANIHSFSYKRLNSYMETFEKKYMKFIEKSYPLLSSPFSAEERESLHQAHEIKVLHQKEVREKIRTKSDVSTEFDDLIKAHSVVEVVSAEKELISIFELDVDLFGLTNGDEE